MDSLDSDLRFARALAGEAAAMATQRQKTISPQEKANESYVTDLDLDLERFLRDRISAEYPNDGLTGEEYEAGGGDGPRRWCIDPIDGTGNLVHGLPLWAISLGLIDRGEPVLGVIAVPPLGEMFWATRGGGAWLDGQRLNVADGETFHSHDNVSVATNALRVLDPRTIPGRIRDLGSACCELVFASCGRLRAAIFLGEQAHDLAAGVVIASEAGCRFGTMDGRALSGREFVEETPVKVPTIIAPPKRLDRLSKTVRRLA
ncbi:MAG TPA: inositol monophosphatase family protein [Isosphaeraceae bacterium]|nr:inositol monophosphatase family protein [Isosphaeraceae bacterium]